jgi:hypothetical protein
MLLGGACRESFSGPCVEGLARDQQHGPEALREQMKQVASTKVSTLR